MQNGFLRGAFLLLRDAVHDVAAGAVVVGFPLHREAPEELLSVSSSS